MFNINAPEFLVILVIALVVIGPQRLPEYAETLGRWVRQVRDMATSARENVRSELGPEFDDVDWAKFDPRQYDPRRIVREALLDPTPAASDSGNDRDFQDDDTSRRDDDRRQDNRRRADESRWDDEKRWDDERCDDDAAGLSVDNSEDPVDVRHSAAPPSLTKTPPASETSPASGSTPDADIVPSAGPDVVDQDAGVLPPFDAEAT